MSGNDPFVISRTFDAPIDRMWAAWTEPSRIAAWMGPKGSGEGKVLSFDFQPGGVLHSVYIAPGGMGETYGKQVYREIEPKTKLVYEQSFSDANGGITRHPLAPLWPLVMLTTITFEDQGDKTHLTLTWDPVDAAPEEQAVFQAAKIGMAGGWGGSFEVLAEFLKDGN